MSPWFLGVHLLRLAVAVMFIYAGAVKLQNPLAFADSIESFRLLPNAVISPLALGLPVFELVVGLFLLTTIGIRIGSCAALILTSTFLVAVGSAVIRGIDVDCGCFGNGPLSTNPWVGLGRNVVLFAVCLPLYLQHLRRAQALANPNEGARSF